ncbi:HypC/HybG/HupF family hydrogenase formation chaperone [Salmonella enterica subsp. enterica serovar Weltevreden]|nr:HypC/HybG/HupF family hydrogenase formation chaperone [Salmonella enterica subsp. enterica serovar Weltevreden]
MAVGDDIHQLAQVEVCGIKRDVNIALTVKLYSRRIGQWVLVHVVYMPSLTKTKRNNVRCAAPHGVRHHQRVILNHLYGIAP